MITRVALVNGDSELILLDHANFNDQLILTSLDIPSPETRAVADNRTDEDGTDDETQHHGARAVSAVVKLCDIPAVLVDQLNSYLHPRSRPYLVVADDEWPAARRLRLRADQWSSPIDHLAHLVREHQLSWRAPDGVWEASDLATFTLNAAEGDTAGRIYPMVMPRTYPPTSSTGAILVTNPGTSWSHQIVRLYGPCNGPRYTNEDTNQTLVFHESLALGLGEYVEVDTRERTALRNSDADSSALTYLDFAISTWWLIPPGQSTVRYHPASGVDPGCQAVVDYRPAWL